MLCNQFYQYNATLTKHWSIALHLIGYRDNYLIALRDAKTWICSESLDTLLDLEILWTTTKCMGTLSEQKYGIINTKVWIKYVSFHKLIGSSRWSSTIHYAVFEQLIVDILGSPTLWSVSLTALIALKVCGLCGATS